MKAGASSLNPYAASYVPLFKRGVNTEFTPGHDLNRGNEVVRHGYPQNSSSLPHAGQVSKQKDITHGGEFFASTSQYPNAVATQKSFDEEFDMDLAYLQMTFPGISEQSLSDVYLANRCDLEATVDMLNQMEIYPDDLMDKLPDTLDIGDVPESVSVGEPSTQKVKNPTGETGAPTPGSANISSARLPH